MKVTNQSTYRSLLNNMDRIQTDLTRSQLVATSGKQLTKASDDPAAVRPALLTRERLLGSERYLRTMDSALDRLTAQEAGLDQAENLLARVNEVVVASGNAALSASDRRTMADEIGQLRESLLAVGNTRSDGKYLFAGYAEETQPFSANPAYNPPVDSRPVLYNGDQGVMRLEISQGEQVAVNINGQSLLLGDDDGDGTPDAGKIDIFALLTRIEDGLRANDQAGVSAELDNVKIAQEQVSDHRTRIGNLAQRVEVSREAMADAQVDLQEMLSRYEDADLAKVLAEMLQQEQALQAAMSVTSRVSKLSILDYL